MLLHNCVCELTACVSTPSCTSASVLDTSMCVQLSSCSTEFWSKWHNWLLLGLQQLWDTIQQEWWVLVSSGLCTNTNCIFICSINVTFMKLHNKTTSVPTHNRLSAALLALLNARFVFCTCTNHMWSHWTICLLWCCWYIDEPLRIQHMMSQDHIVICLWRQDEAEAIMLFLQAGCHLHSATWRYKE